MAHSVPAGATGSDVAEMRSVAVGSRSEAALRLAGRGAYSRRPERTIWKLPTDGGATGSDVAEMRSVAVESLSEAAIRVAGWSAYSRRPERTIWKLPTDGGAPEGRRPERSFWSLSIEGWTLQLWVRWTRSVTDRHQEKVAAL